jgi:hypothetical protein
MNRFAVCFTSAQLALAASALANSAPTVVIKSATMRGATGLMDVVFRVNDPDDATVKTRALAFIDGQRSFAKVIKPTTFAEGTGTKLGDAIASNTDHTLTWNVVADWNISLGLIKFEILAMDGRGLLPLNWVTIPAANGQPELTISKNAPTDQETLDALFWQYASGDPGLVLEDGVLRGSPASGILESAVVADGQTAKFYGPVYILKQMDLAVAHEGHTERCTAARIELSEPLRWRALRKPFELFQPGVVWGNIGDGKPIAGLAGVTSTTDRLAITRTGDVITWWRHDRLKVPKNASSIVSIAQGGNQYIALKNDGTCIAWIDGGFDVNGVTTIPASATQIKQIASGYNHFLALKHDGTLIAWGSNSNGQCEVSAFHDIKSLPKQGHPFAALRQNGFAIDINNSGLIENDYREYESLYSAYYYYIGIQSDSTAFFKGRFDASSGPQFIPPQQTLSNVVAASTGDFHALILRGDGTVTAWGSNHDGQCDVPVGLSGVQYVYASSSGLSLALKKAPRQP